MSEEIERIIKECSGVDTFDYVITPQQRDTMRLADYIKELQKENQQLKNDNAVMKAGLIQIRDERLEKYKSVLDEIREYIESTDYDYAGAKCTLKDTVIGEKILQILDKVKE